jgi:hypothetical protein
MAEHQTPSAALNERDAAIYIGFTPAALRAWRHFGRGPAYIRHGRTIRYLVPDLDRWHEQHRVEPRELAEAAGR